MVVFVASSLAFVLLQVAPGDPYSHLYQVEGMTPETLAELRLRYGHDKPVLVQYGLWVKAMASGHFGESTVARRPVSAVLAETIPNTVLLMSLALVASIVFGVILGQWQAARDGSHGDRVVSAASFVVFSMPEFWLAMMLLWLLNGKLGLFATSGFDSALADYMTPFERVVDRLEHIVLPWLSLTIVGTAVFARYQRAAMRDVLTEAFVENARARGLPEDAVLRHARRASLTPVITLGGLYLPAVVGGAVFVERVFSWEGMGLALVRGAGDNDYALVAAIVVVGSTLTVLASLAADIIREIVDPRLRTS